MPVLPEGILKAKRGQVTALHQAREDYRAYWQDLANYILPYRYASLTNPDSDAKRRANHRNEYILDPTGSKAATNLAAGMLNGITSPARPWFRLRIANFQDEMEHPARVYLDEVTRRMLRVMAESNFYKALATMYQELGVFGTAAFLIYEDFEEVIRCYNSPVGEFYLSQNAQGKIDTFARRISYSVKQCVERFGLENCSTTVKEKYKKGGAAQYETVQIEHLIEPVTAETRRKYRLPPSMRFAELYYECAPGDNPNRALALYGFREYPGITPRWNTTANDIYGTDSPGMNAFPDILQLQHESKKRAQLLDYMAEPPLVADQSLQNKPNVFMPGSITYARLDSQAAGAKPVYQVNPPFAEITQDIIVIQNRIKETFHNDLFSMISQLDTVRSATEIDARREEKLVMLGPVLSRFENEALDPAIKRVYSIMERKGLLPPPPEELQDTEIEVQYVSILADAQAAVSTAPIERYLAFTGELAAVYPDIIEVPNAEELNRIYADRLGVPAAGINSRKALAEKRMQNEARRQEQAMLEQTAVGIDAAKSLSETQVGGGVNALQALLGG